MAAKMFIEQLPLLKSIAELKNIQRFRRHNATNNASLCDRKI